MNAANGDEDPKIRELRWIRRLLAALLCRRDRIEQKAFLQKMGFLNRVNIELKERGRTLTPGANWGPLETMTVDFGHGMSAWVPRSAVRHERWTAEEIARVKEVAEEIGRDLGLDWATDSVSKAADSQEKTNV